MALCRGSKGWETHRICKGGKRYRPENVKDSFFPFGQNTVRWRGDAPLWKGEKIKGPHHQKKVRKGEA